MGWFFKILPTPKIDSGREVKLNGALYIAWRIFLAALLACCAPGPKETSGILERNEVTRARVRPEGSSCNTFYIWPIGSAGLAREY